MKKSLIILTLLLGFCSMAWAQSEPARLAEKEKTEAAKTVTGNYRDWQRVTLSGKLDLEGVAISPSVKIYMERGKRIVMSIRVPLLGEVGTLEVNGGQVTIVNKVKKTYCREDVSGLMADLPVGLNDLQDLFLGRIFLPDYGTLSMDNYGKTDFYVADDVEGWFILPQEQPVQYDVSCGYNTDGLGRTDNIFVTTLDKQNQATAYYTYDGDKVEIELAVRTRGKDHNFVFRINETDYSGKPVKAAAVDSKYRKVGLSEFFKSLL